MSDSGPGGLDPGEAGELHRLVRHRGLHAAVRELPGLPRVLHAAGGGAGLGVLPDPDGQRARREDHQYVRAGLLRQEPRGGAGLQPQQEHPQPPHQLPHLPQGTRALTQCAIICCQNFCGIRGQKLGGLNMEFMTKLRGLLEAIDLRDCEYDDSEEIDD